MLLIMIPDQYPNYDKSLEIYTGYFDSLDIMILFSYPSSIVITRDYCTSLVTYNVSAITCCPSRQTVHIFLFLYLIYYKITICLQDETGLSQH